MKTIRHALLAALMLFAWANHCTAEMTVRHLSRQQAKELGVELRLKDNGPNEVWVELEFKAEGDFKNFQHVSLEIREDRKLLVGYAPLREKRLESGKVVVRFMASRNYLDKVTLMIVTGVPMDYSGHDLRVKDFLETERSR